MRFDIFNENSSNEKKLIWILAKSIKHGAFCIAGKDVHTNDWIRLVSNSDGGSLSEEQSRVYFEGASQKEPWGVRVNDLVEIVFVKRVSIIGQPENWQISSKVWTLKNNSKRYYQPDLFFDSPHDLWGHGNKVSHSVLGQIKESLYLVRVNNFEIYQVGYEGKYKLKARFLYNGQAYENFAVTDPEYHRKAGELGDVTLVVSLGQEFVEDHCHYKIVGKIFKEGEIK